LQKGKEVNSTFFANKKNVENVIKQLETKEKNRMIY
jgi:hypothetical protein